jgi:hypothetical protein
VDSEALLAAVRALWRHLGRPPVIREWQAWAARPAHWTTLYHRFGGWRETLLLAWEPSLGPYDHPVKPSPAMTTLISQDPDTLDPWQRRIRDLRLTGLSVVEIGEALGCNRETVLRYARRGARPPGGSGVKWTRTNVLVAMRRAYAQHGDAVLASARWRPLVPAPAVTTIASLFGTWVDAWEAAVPGAHPRSLAGTVRRLREAESQHGPVVRHQSVWRGLGLHPHPQTVARYGGSWEAAWAAVDAAKLEEVSS